MNSGARDVEGYLAALPGDQRAALEKVRAAIKSAAPEAAEGFAYGMPSFKYRGRPLVYVGAAKNYCGLYGMSSVFEAHKDELARFEMSKGTLRFAVAKPPADALVRKLVKARMAEIEAGEAAKKAGKK